MEFSLNPVDANTMFWPWSEGSLFCYKLPEGEYGACPGQLTTHLACANAWRLIYSPKKGHGAMRYLLLGELLEWSMLIYMPHRARGMGHNSSPARTWALLSWVPSGQPSSHLVVARSVCFLEIHSTPMSQTLLWRSLRNETEWGWLRERSCTYRDGEHQGGSVPPQPGHSTDTCSERS